MQIDGSNCINDIIYSIYDIITIEIFKKIVSLTLFLKSFKW